MIGVLYCIGGLLMIVAGIVREPDNPVAPICGMLCFILAYLARILEYLRERQ
jgi:hypothetical protein